MAQSSRKSLIEQGIPKDKWPEHAKSTDALIKIHLEYNESTTKLNSLFTKLTDKDVPQSRHKLLLAADEPAGKASVKLTELCDLIEEHPDTAAVETKASEHNGKKRKSTLIKPVKSPDKLVQTFSLYYACTKLLSFLAGELNLHADEKIRHNLLLRMHVFATEAMEKLVSIRKIINEERAATPVELPSPQHSEKELKLPDIAPPAAAPAQATPYRRRFHTDAEALPPPIRQVQGLLLLNGKSGRQAMSRKGTTNPDRAILVNPVFGKR